MRPDRSEEARLADMLKAAETICRFVHGRTLDDYLSDDMLRSAVERQIEIIGEAARFVSVRTRNAHPDIPWQAIIVQRHVLVHEYGEILDEKIWRVATLHAPVLIDKLRAMLPPLPPA